MKTSKLTKMQRRQRYLTIKNIASKTRRRNEHQLYQQFKSYYQSLFDSREFVELI